MFRGNVQLIRLPGEHDVLRVYQKRKAGGEKRLDYVCDKEGETRAEAVANAIEAYAATTRNSRVLASERGGV